MTKKHVGLNHSKSSHDRRVKENAPKPETKQALATPSIISAASFRSVANLNRNKTNMVVMKVIPTNKPSNHSEHKEQQKDSLKSKSYAFGSESSLTTSNSSTSNHAERKHDVQANNCTSSSSKRLSFSNENMSFMNSVLAQIGV